MGVIILEEKLKNLSKIVLLVGFSLSLTACSKQQTEPQFVPPDKKTTTVKIVNKPLKPHKPAKRLTKPLNGFLPHRCFPANSQQSKKAIYTNLNAVLKK